MQDQSIQQAAASVASSVLPSTQEELRAYLKARCDTFFETPSVWPVIEAAYSEPHRAYHNLQHLAELFDVLERTCGSLNALPHSRAIKLAIWFHDFVYRTDSLEAYGENELRSAMSILTVLAGAAPAWLEGDLRVQVALAGELILATKRHSEEGAALGQDAERLRACRLFLDADLSILAAPPARFREYDEAIAREWGQNPKRPAKAFVEGRTAALGKLMARERLFLTPEFERMEAPARENLRAKLGAAA